MTYLSKNSINEKHNNKYSNILTTIPGKKFFFFLIKQQYAKFLKIIIIFEM